MPAETVWDEKLLENPHTAADKRKRVQKMFASIAPSYDLNNHLHSLYIDQYWRKRTVRLANLNATDVVVDVACGTGDLTYAFAKALYVERDSPSAPGFTRDEYPPVVGIDFTFEMLPIAYRKQTKVRGPAEDTWFLNGDAQSLPLPDASADVVSIAFGIRNVQDTPAALREFRRVLRPGGRCMILEFSRPKNPVVRWGYDLYCSKIMPLTATLISGDKSGAYKYLPHSVATFLTPEQMIEKLEAAGFAKVEAFPLTFGAVVVYRATV